MSDSSETKTPGKTPMRAGARGGQLKTGNAGNRGGSGRPPARLRARMYKMAKTHLKIIGKILKDEASSNSDKLRAMELLLRFALDRSISVVDLRDALRALSELAYEVFPRDQADAFLTRAGPIFKQL